MGQPAAALSITDKDFPPHPTPFLELQEKTAELLGVEQTLFVPTNTMANLISGELAPQVLSAHSDPLFPFVDDISGFLFSAPSVVPWQELGGG